MKRTPFFAFLITLSLFSCKKDPSLIQPAINIPQSGLTTLEPLTIMLHLVERKPADFTIFISSSIGSGLYESTTIKNGSTSISAHHITETAVGNFTVNSYKVPYNYKSYFFQVDTNQTSAFLTGRTNTYELEGTSFPSFALQDYATTLPLSSYSGLKDYKLPSDSDLVINWTVDPQFPAGGKAVAIVSYENEQSGVLTTFHKKVDQFAGKATFTVSELSAFKGKPYLKIYFAKGTLTEHIVRGKTIAIENHVFSWSRIYR